MGLLHLLLYLLVRVISFRFAGPELTLVACSLYVIYSLVFTSRKTSYLRSERVGKLFVAISWFTIILWSLYPVAWALSGSYRNFRHVIVPVAEKRFRYAEGTNYLSANQEVLFVSLAPPVSHRPLADMEACSTASSTFSRNPSSASGF